MITIRRQLLGLGFVAASSLLAIHAAQAMNGPAAIQIDGGPLGALQLSGGVDGYGYYLGNTASGQLDHGANVANALVELQKSSGVLQFTIEVGSNGGAVTLGAPGFTNNRLNQTSISTFTTGPLYAGYITIAPTDSPVTISAGQIGSLEGYESGIDWNNSVQLTTDLFYVENSQARGVQLNYSQGPISASVQFGDGFDTGVFNFMQALVSYTINSTNSVSIFGAANLGKTGGANGANLVNSDMIGGYYSYTQGNLNIVPEVQYVYAKPSQSLGLAKGSSNFGAAVFANYAYGTSPYSLGGWVEYENSNGKDLWFVGPGSEAVGAAVAPTWQYKDLFARVNGGALYLLNNKQFSTGAYGTNRTSKIEYMATLEAGLLF